MSDQPRPTGPEQDNHRWLRGLRDLAQNWLKETGGLIGQREVGRTKRGAAIYVPAPIPMDAYANLTFAFGLARVGGRIESRELLDGAQAVLTSLKDRTHAALLKGYEHQITRALEGKAHVGPSPARWEQWTEGTGRLDRYIVDRVRKHSHILEPDTRVNPYREWGARVSDLSRALAELAEVSDPEDIIRRVEHLLRGPPSGRKGEEQPALILDAALNVAARANPAFVRQLLDRTLAFYEALPEPQGPRDFSDLAFRLERMFFVAAWFNLRDRVTALAACFRRLLRVEGPRTVRRVPLALALGQCVRALQKVRAREELASVVAEARKLLLDERGLPQNIPEQPADDPEAFLPLPPLAAGLFSQGQNQEAEAVLATIRPLLFRADQQGTATPVPVHPRIQAALAARYAEALGQAPAAEATGRLEELFHFLDGVSDTLTSMSHVSVSRLEVIEAAVLSAVEVLTRPDEPLTVTT
jgi:hypothetical protein